MPLVTTETRTRLHVEGVPSAIIANVARRGDDGMVVTQSLPFLRLDTAVTEGGRRTRIARVAIAMDGDVPKLLLELHDEPDEEDTVETFTPGVSAMPARTDSTVPYEFQEREGAAEIVLTDAVPILPSVVRLTAPAPWYVRFARRIVAVFVGMITARAWS